MITAKRVTELTDKVVALNNQSADKSDLAKFNRIYRVIDANCGKDIRQRMFQAIQREMSRRSAEKRRADAAALKAFAKIAS